MKTTDYMREVNTLLATFVTVSDTFSHRKKGTISAAAEVTKGDMHPYRKGNK